jgi:hypothetical protein
MARVSEWAVKVMGLVKSGNAPAAIAQIKVAPSLKDLTALQGQLQLPGHQKRWPDVEHAVRDNLAMLSAPRLHRSP